MAFGRPVASTAVFGIPELVEDGVSGFLCRDRDLGALREMLERVADTSRDDLISMGAARPGCRHHPPRPERLRELLPRGAGHSCPVTGAPSRSSVTASSAAAWPRLRSPVAGRCARWTGRRPVLPARVGPRSRRPGRRRAPPRRARRGAGGGRPRRLGCRHREAGRVQRAPDARDRGQPGSSAGHPRGHPPSVRVRVHPALVGRDRLRARRADADPRDRPAVADQHVRRPQGRRRALRRPSTHGSPASPPTSSAAPTSTGRASRTTGRRG